MCRQLQSHQLFSCLVSICRSDFVDSNVQSISNVSISEINQTVILSQASKFELVVGLSILNWSQGIKLTKLSSINIQSSNFTALGSINVIFRL